MQNVLDSARPPVPPTAVPPTWPRVAILVGPVAAVVVAWLCSLPDDAVENGLTLPNVALLMAVVTVGFALLDSAAGVSTSIVAALALNYFHTVPYRTLRITDRRDVYSVVLLGALGIAVSSISALRVRRNIRLVRQSVAQDTGRELASLLGSDQPAPQIWAAAISASSSDLALVTARIASTQPYGLAVVRRRFHEGDDPMFVLPAGGATLHLSGNGTGDRDAMPKAAGASDEGPWLIIAPLAGLGGLEVDRRAVLAFADTIELGLESAHIV